MIFQIIGIVVDGNDQYSDVIREYDTRKEAEDFLNDPDNFDGSFVNPEIIEVQSCELCGCTNEHACPGGCQWIDEPDCTICSQCAWLSVELVKKLKPLAMKHSFEAYENPKKKPAFDKQFATDVKSLLEQFEDREFEDDES